MNNRILTTHVGSLPRNADVTRFLNAHEQGEPFDPVERDEVLSRAVIDIVAQQVEAGVDIVSDGEMSKISYATYIKDRISGFDGDTPRDPPADLEMFPAFLKRQASSGGTPIYRRPRCIGPVAHVDMKPLEDDITRMDAACAAANPSGRFMNSASPGVIALFQPNDHYSTQDDYLEALAEAMRPEYERIVDAGYQLQIDCPDFGYGRHSMFKGRSDEEYARAVSRHVEVLNHALRNIPAEKIRMHVCWGNYEGPHCCDVSMEVVLPLMLQAKPAMLLFETANPRHRHEWRYIVERRDEIPEEKILVPGLIDSTSNFVEHPLQIADELCRYADIVGRDRVMAGSDCGFSTFAGFGAVDPDIVFAKLGALAEGAALASERLWGGRQ